MPAHPGACIAGLLLAAGLAVRFALSGPAHAEQVPCGDPRCLLEQALTIREAIGKPTTDIAETSSFAALGLFDEADAIVARHPAPTWRASILPNLGLARALAGDRTTAIALFHDAAAALETFLETFGIDDTRVFEPLLDLVADMARAGDVHGARITAITVTRGRLPWMRSIVLARLAAAAEEAGAPDPAFWDEAAMLTTAFDYPDWNLLAMQGVARCKASPASPRRPGTRTRPSRSPTTPTP